MALHELLLSPVRNCGIVRPDPSLSLGCAWSPLMRIEHEIARALDGDDVCEMGTGREVLLDVGRRVGRYNLYMVGDPARG
jgi:hypothetical protein